MSVKSEENDTLKKAITIKHFEILSRVTQVHSKVIEGKIHTKITIKV